MELAKPWHPFRIRGLCGLSRTNCVLTVIALLIYGVIIFLTAELEKTTRATLMGSNDSVSEDYEMEDNETSIRRIRRSTATLIVPVQGLTENILNLKEGSSVQFDCNPFEKNCPGCGNQGTTSYAPTYFCKDPCKWADVKAYTDPTSYGKDKRFRMVKHNRHGNNNDGMRVLITAVRMSDQGKYFCAIDKTGTDWYEAFSVVVREQPPVRPNIRPVFTPATKEELTWMGREGTVSGSVQRAAEKCHGNRACTLALLQKQELEIKTSCWLCLQMTHAWEAIPLTVKTIKDTTCLVPGEMTQVLDIAEDIEMGRTPILSPKPFCTLKYEREKPKGALPPLRVTHKQGDVCVCQKEDTDERMDNTGESACRIRIDVVKRRADLCTATVNGVAKNFSCPFNELQETSPAAVWVCGDKAYHYLPKGTWKGCCYPALMHVGTSVYLPHGESAQQGRKRREIHVLPETLPEHYKGYVLSNPWTSPGANFRWSLLLGGGTAVSINKINGLAWTVLAMANETELALTMINDEMKEIRSAVIQNRLALDLLTSEKGGVCKLLGTSCCFHIPDFSDNITDIVTHMKQAVKEPEQVTSNWVNWFESLGGGWMHWILYTVLPIGIVGLMVIICLPCIYKCLSCAIQRVMMSEKEHQLMRLPMYTDDMFLEWSGKEQGESETKSEESSA